MWTELKDWDSMFVCPFSDETDVGNPCSEATL